MLFCEQHVSIRPTAPPPTQEQSGAFNYPLPVSGFVLALILPIVGIFIARSQMKLAEYEGRDNQLARAGFYYSAVALSVVGAVVFIYLIVFIVALSAAS